MNILITGGNRGLGLALVKVFAKGGHRVYALIRNEAAAQQIAQAYPLVKIMIADVTKAEQLANVDQQLETSLDVLINNAGSGSRGASIFDAQVDEMEKQFKVHCLGAMNAMQAVMPMLSRAEYPLIINVSSRLASMSKNAGNEFTGKGFSYAYRIAIGAQNMLTLCLAQELGPRGFRVCALHPGRLITDSGSPDALLSADDSAAAIYRMVLAGDFKNAGYYCIESGCIDW